MGSAPAECLARGFAASACLGADAAVLVRLAVLLALRRALAARGRACLDDSTATAGLAPCPRRDVTRPAAMQRSAQSSFSRMHCLSMSICVALRHASAHAVHDCAQSKHASTQAASLPRLALCFCAAGLVSIIFSVECCMLWLPALLGRNARALAAT